jgi:hypothetical protein
LTTLSANNRVLTSATVLRFVGYCKKTAIETLHDDDLQANPRVRHGLQGIIPDCCYLIAIPQHSNGKKVSMLVMQARNELKGR